MESTIKDVIVKELHKPARRKYPRRKTVLKGIDDLWQIDLVEMLPYAKANNGKRYLLTVIDCLSKFGFAIPIKRKTGEETSKALETIFRSSKRVPKHIQSDAGKEFYNPKFKALMAKYQIKHYSTYSNMKAAIVERFNRTLKSKMWKAFSLKGNYKYLDSLPQLLKEYNSTVHRTIGMRPIDASLKKNEEFLLRKIYSPRGKSKKPKYAEGDHVRISKRKTLFAKGYTPNWSAEIFKITNVQNTEPYTYLLSDMKNQEIKGGFYEEELQKVKYPDVYLVEKVLKKKGNKVYVRWLGTGDYSWIDKDNVV